MVANNLTGQVWCCMYCKTNREYELINHLFNKQRCKRVFYFSVTYSKILFEGVNLTSYSPAREKLIMF